MSNFQPIAASNFIYVNGMQISWTSVTTLSITAGQCRDSTNNIDISIGNPYTSSAVSTTVNLATTGLNALDTGALANTTWYYIYAIGDSSFYNPTGFIVSTNPTTPQLPVGYDSIRVVGYWVTDGSAHLRKGYITGNGGNKSFVYDAPVSVLSSGTQTGSFALVNLANGVPPINNTFATLTVSFLAASAGAFVTLVPGDSTSTTGVQVSDGVSTQAQLVQAKVLSRIVTTNAQILYENSIASCATTLLVQGFDYSI